MGTSVRISHGVKHTGDEMRKNTVRNEQMSEGDAEKQKTENKNLS